MHDWREPHNAAAGQHHNADGANQASTPMTRAPRLHPTIGVHMSPEERALYSTTLYLIGDDVEIAGTGIYGEVTGIRIEAWSEDQYQVFYIDNNGNPQERWWKASALEPADGDSDQANSNILPFPVKSAIAEARHATKH